MIYSATAKYAVLAMTQLALTAPDDLIPIRTIADKTSVPYHYLTKVMQTLVKNGLLRSVKGKGGGLCLARSAESIKISEIVIAIDGSDALNTCIFGVSVCDGSRGCSLHPSWEPVRAKIHAFLDGSLAGLARPPETIQSN